MDKRANVLSIYVIKEIEGLQNYSYILTLLFASQLWSGVSEE